MRNKTGIGLLVMSALSFLLFPTFLVSLVLGFPVILLTVGTVLLVTK